MQLIEFFIWRNIDNKIYNNLFSIFSALLLIIQPMASIMLVTNIQLRNLLLVSYLLMAIPVSIYEFSTKHFHSVVSEGGYLKWKFFQPTPIIWVVFWVVWLFFFLFSFIYEKKWFGLIFALVTLINVYINYKMDQTFLIFFCLILN